jgi:hypothetical protein
MPTHNQVYLRGQVAEPSYFDLVPAGQRGSNRKIEYLRVWLNVPRDDSQPQPPDRPPFDRLRVVAYGGLAKGLQAKQMEVGDWLIVSGWLQVRRRPTGAVTVEVVGTKIDHVMQPLAPHGAALQRLEELAAAQQISPRVALEQLLLQTSSNGNG